jgi:hypothetical protein
VKLILLKHVVIFLAYEYWGVIIIVAEIFALLSCAASFVCSFQTFQYILTFEDGFYSLSQEVGSKISIDDVQDPSRMKTSTSLWHKPKISHNMIAVLKLLMNTTSPTVVAWMHVIDQDHLWMKAGHLSLNSKCY